MTSEPALRALTIGGWEFVAELGRGAGSAVHHVRRDGGDYVLKLLPAVPDPVPVAAALRRQALLLADAGHPGLPITYEVGVVGERPYLVTDLVPGRPLADLLVDSPLAPDAVRSLAVDLAGMLDVAHRRGLAHGRITAENVLVDPDGGAHLVDFGGVILDRGRQAGTPGDAERDDLHAVGVVLFQCLTGVRPPADRPAPAEDLAEDLRVSVPGLPDDLAVVVGRLLAPDPADRYPTASALLTACSASS